MQRQDQGETGDVVQTMNPAAVVREFWRLMASNDFESVRQVLAADFVMEWPELVKYSGAPERAPESVSI